MCQVTWPIFLSDFALGSRQNSNISFCEKVKACLKFFLTNETRFRVNLLGPQWNMVALMMMLVVRYLKRRNSIVLKFHMNNSSNLKVTGLRGKLCVAFLLF